MKNKIVPIIVVAVILIVAGVFIFTKSSKENSLSSDSSADSSYTNESLKKGLGGFGADNSDGSSEEEAPPDVSTGVVMEDIGLFIYTSGYQMDGPIHMALRNDVNATFLNREGQGYTVRTTEEDQNYMAAVEAVEKRLGQIGFKKKVFNPKNDSSPVKEYRQYTLSNVVCLFEKRAIGSTGNVDIIIGCFDK